MFPPPFMSRIYYQLPHSKTREPDVATVISRSIFMSCHDGACHVMFEIDLESRTDIIKWKGTAYTPNVPPLPPAQKCLNTIDHLMYNLINLTTQEPPPLGLNHQPGTQPHTRKPGKKTCLYKTFITPVLELPNCQNYYSTKMECYNTIVS